MASTSRKRSRPESADEGKAECPFTVKYVSPEEKAKARSSQKGKKRRKPGSPSAGVEEEDLAKLQNSPFAPSGKFRNDENLDLHYRVEPRDKWLSMTRYNSFVLNQAKYFSEGFIYVANDSTVAPKPSSAERSGAKRQPDEWVARILEIRAADEHHVYARVYWMYWPEEIPVGTKDGGKFVVGRQPYHGHHELVASNHMDVINVVSVTQEAKVKQWFEENDDEIQDALYWRQAFDVRSMQLSSIQRICKCQQPANPDKTLVACPLPAETCGQWLHEECLKHEALMKTFEELGTDKPYQRPAASVPTKNGDTVKVDKAEDEAGRPLSPPDNSAEVQQTIDAKLGGASEDVVKAGLRDTPAVASNPRASVGTEGSFVATPGTGRRGRKKKVQGGSDHKPYAGLFEATLKLTSGPSMVEITDLRTNVRGDEKTWTQPLACLLCGTTIV